MYVYMYPVIFVPIRKVLSSDLRHRGKTHSIGCSIDIQQQAGAYSYSVKYIVSKLDATPFGLSASYIYTIGLYRN